MRKRFAGQSADEMDHEGWYAYVYPKSLGAHEFPKLGVPRLCERLRASADPQGGVYLDNVDVNGILPAPDGPSLWTLLGLLNSRLADWVFHLHSVPFRGAFMSANKQFIAPLPIRVPEGAERRRFDELGERLCRRSRELGEERRGFLVWLGGTIGARPAELQGSTTLASYDEHTLEDLLQVLQGNQTRLERDVGSRAFREEFEQELNASLDRIGDHQASLTADEATADDAVFELYELSREQRALVEGETEVQAQTA